MLRKSFEKKKELKNKEEIPENVMQDKRQSFRENIKKIENEETKLLKLQKQYEEGNIKEEELSSEQVELLCDLYDKQIEALRRSNEKRKEKLRQLFKQLKKDKD